MTTTSNGFINAASPEAALRMSIEILDEIVSLFDRMGLMVPAVHAATALHAARAALEVEVLAGVAELTA